MIIKPNHSQHQSSRSQFASFCYFLRDTIRIKRKASAQTRVQRSARKVSSPVVLPQPNKGTATRRRVRYDRIILTAIFLCLLLYLMIYGFYSCIKHSKPEVRAVNAEVSIVTTTEPIQTTLSPMELEQRHAMYPQALVVMGDSIASGFHLYDFIPDEHGLAHGSVAIRNLHDFTFSCEGEEMDALDAVERLQPAYLYMSMGMNDLNIISSEEYNTLYRTEIENILRIAPETNIIVGAITPIEATSDFTSNTRIQEYNAVLQEMVKSFARSNVIYFDAYSILADPATQALREEYSAGDGVHLSTKSYEVLLQMMYPYLDAMPYTAACAAALGNASATTTITTAAVTTDGIETTT